MVPGQIRVEFITGCECEFVRGELPGFLDLGFGFLVFVCAKVNFLIGDIKSL